MSITIEEGKRYVTRGGSDTGPMVRNTNFPHSVYPWRDSLYSRTYLGNGRFDLEFQVSPYDLVREYIEPSTPVEPVTAATEDSVPLESPDDWVTQDRVPARPGIDERSYNDDDDWDDARVINWGSVRPAVHGSKSITGATLKLRCRRKDLPLIQGTAVTEVSVPLIRQFETGATRNLDGNKLDYEGFFSPLAMKSFAEYMHSHRKQKDGTMRDADNWQKGIPDTVYMKSMWRHFMDVWSLHRGGSAVSPDTGEAVDMVEALNAVMFNVQGYLHELLKKENQV